MPQPRIYSADVRHHISLATALWLIACGTHRWSLDNRSVERVPTPDPLREKPSPRMCRNQTPDPALPPAELPGLRFQEPQSLTWREQHRQVVISERGHEARN